jgi:hypothetical protein
MPTNNKANSRISLPPRGFDELDFDELDFDILISPILPAFSRAGQRC